MTKRRPFIFAASALLAGGLLWLLARSSSADGDALFAAISEADAATIALGGLSVAIPVWFGALKWRLVLNRFFARADTARFSFHLHYTALSTVVGLITTPLLSGPLVRGYATARETEGFSRGASSSVVEQVFDIVVTAVFAFCGVVLVLNGGAGSLALSLLLGAAFGVVAFGYVAARSPRLKRLAVAVATKTPLRRLKQLSAAISLLGDPARDDAGVVARLLGYSVVRFWANALRAVAVAMVLGGPEGVATVLLAFAAVQVVQFAPLTPGNFGTTEWGWSFALILLGWPFEIAAIFAFLVRGLGVFGALATFAVAAMWRFFDRTASEA